MLKVETYSVPQLKKEERLSDFAVGKFSTITSKKGIKKAIKKGLIFIDEKQGFTGDYIRGGETIDLYQTTEEKHKPVIDLQLDVVFEDDYLAIVYKPAGITVSDNKKWTLEHALPFNLKPSLQKDSLTYPEPIHRLDYPTSGAILIGKTKSSVIALNKFFENREIQKIYHAITIGNMDLEGECNTPIDGKVSRSLYTVLETVVSEKYECLNLVKLTPHTGRKHQLRKHMTELGNPIFGDAQYGKKDLILKGKGLYLHASSLEFLHPFTQKIISISIPLPKKFLKVFPKHT